MMQAAVAAVALPTSAFVEELVATRRVIISTDVKRDRKGTVQMVGRTTHVFSTHETSTNRSPTADTNIHVVSPRTNQSTYNTNDVYQPKST